MARRGRHKRCRMCWERQLSAVCIVEQEKRQWLKTSTMKSGACTTAMAWLWLGFGHLSRLVAVGVFIGVKFLQRGMIC
ncbi:hypothetical protein AMTRI_Chr13g89910 [Amborella trichopoda]